MKGDAIYKAKMRVISAAMGWFHRDPHDIAIWISEPRALADNLKRLDDACEHLHVLLEARRKEGESG